MKAGRKSTSETGSGRCMLSLSTTAADDGVTQAFFPEGRYNLFIKSNVADKSRECYIRREAMYILDFGETTASFNKRS
jgi:hypothetical protein